MNAARVGLDMVANAEITGSISAADAAYSKGRKKRIWWEGRACFIDIQSGLCTGANIFCLLFLRIQSNCDGNGGDIG